MSDPSNDLLNLRRSVRYFVSQPDAVQAHMEYDVEGVRRQERCELLDISTQGLKLKTSCYPAIHQEMRVRIRIDSCRLELDLAGSICWSRPRENDTCWVGVLLYDEISPAQLDRIAVQGVIDRRRDRRLTIGAEALVRFELASSSFSARILDLSPRGFSVITAGTATVGDRILLLVPQANDDGLPIPGRICWLRPEKEDFIYGCEFLSSSASSDVRARLTLRESQEDSRRLKQRIARTERALPLLIPAACVAMLLCWQYGSPAVDSSSEPVCLTPPVHVEVVANAQATSPVNARPQLPAITQMSVKTPPLVHPLVHYVDWFFEQWRRLRAEPGGQ